MSDKLIENYPFDKKKKLLEKINKLSSRADFEQVSKIIAENNPELGSMKNANGMFMRFDTMTTKTYLELTSFLDKVDKRKQKQMVNTIRESSDVFSQEEDDDKNFTLSGTRDSHVTSEKNISKKLRLTNAESHILNRVKYENELKKNESEFGELEELTVYGSVPQTKTSTKAAKTKAKIDDIFLHADEEDPGLKKKPPKASKQVVKPATKQLVKKTK